MSAGLEISNKLYGCNVSLSYDDVVGLGYDHIHLYVMRVGVDALLDELKVRSDANLWGFGVGEQAVVITFATSYAVALTVKGYGRHYYQFDFVDIGGVVARGLFDVE